MRKPLLILAGLMLALPAGAALPPRFQNAKDLDVMVAWAKDHPQVMESLRAIDVQEKIVAYGKDCRATFARAIRIKPAGWVGPAAPLEFQSSTCPTD